VDSGLLAYALMESADDLHAIRPALDEFWNVVKSRIGNDGTVCYRSHLVRFRFVDTIGFICPFLVRYGQAFNVPEAVDLAVRQITSFDQAMLGDTMIPPHAWNIETGLPSGIFGWGRGMGWYAIGLIDAWRALDSGHPGKAELQQRVETFAAAILSLQRENGGWGWNATNPHAITDSSATATLAWFLTCAATLPEWHERAKLARKRAVAYLMGVTRRDGTIDFSQGDTKDIGVYSQIFDRLPFTQGFALRCAATRISTPNQPE
jgi:unsaturated rhamnogalacturonyl hydrolase